MILVPVMPASPTRAVIPPVVNCVDGCVGADGMHVIWAFLTLIVGHANRWDRQLPGDIELFCFGFVGWWIPRTYRFKSLSSIFSHSLLLLILNDVSFCSTLLHFQTHDESTLIHYRTHSHYLDLAISLDPIFIVLAFKNESLTSDQSRLSHRSCP